MRRDAIKEREREAIWKSLRSHPTILLLGPTQSSTQRVLETLILHHSDAEGEEDLIKNMRHPDLTVVDARNINTTEAREIRSGLSASPAKWSNRYFILGHADRLHNTAAQTLLKLIEEPPKTLKVLLVTDNIEKIPLTIQSRSIQYTVSIPTKREIEEWLQEKGVEEAVWRARVAGGDADVALELNPEITKEWDKLVATVAAKNLPTPIMPITWTEKLKDENEATQVACWNIVIATATRFPTNPFWRRCAQTAMAERERVVRDKRKIYLSTALVQCYALWKTAVKKR